MRTHSVVLATIHPNLVARTPAQLDVSVEVIQPANIDSATASISRGGTKAGWLLMMFRGDKQERWVANDDVYCRATGRMVGYS